jgi:Family of unknown function (DUF6502)
MRSSPSTPADDGADAALREALDRLMAPLAELCLARGLSFAAAEEMFKRAFVDAARNASSAAAVTRDISRISAATGLTRREVTRITLDGEARAAVRPSPATQIFTRWMGSRRLHDKNGEPRPLRRQGKAPSFEALAQAVTRDVHPRTLLEELCRLGLATLDEQTDMVSLARDSFVPRKDKTRMYGFLGNNVGDHMAAAVANVLAEKPPHLEQAIFADELSQESAAAVRALVAAQWKELLAGLVPKIQGLIDADEKSGRTADRRVRVGLYSYHAPMARTTNDPEEKA